MNYLTSDSEPTGQPGIFELRRLSMFTLLAFWQTEDTATQEIPSPLALSWKHVHNKCSEFHCNSDAISTK